MVLYMFFCNCDSSNPLQQIIFQYIEEWCQKMNKLIITNSVNMASVAFYQVISTEKFVEVQHIMPKYCEKLKRSAWTTKNTLNVCITLIENECERTWILKLRSLYPYDVNVRVGGLFRKDVNRIYLDEHLTQPRRRCIKLKTKIFHNGDAFLFFCSWYGGIM